MTKRERDAIVRKLDKLTARIGTKRDELRKLIEDVEPLIESVTTGTEELDGAVGLLREAKDRLESAADTVSQYA